MDDDPYLELAILRQTSCMQIGDEPVREAVLAALRAEQCQRAELSIALVDDAQIAELHERHLEQSGPTDVLTFDLRCEARDPREYLDGEIVVSTETATRVAKTLGHSAEAELLLYVIHGLLHLLGYNDHTAEDAAQMRARQHALLAAAGYPIPVVEAETE